jgi:hypothetical protein
LTISIKALNTVQLVNNLTVNNKTHRKGNAYLLSLIRSPFTESIDSYNQSPFPSPTHQLQNETETEKSNNKIGLHCMANSITSPSLCVKDLNLMQILLSPNPLCRNLNWATQEYFAWQNNKSKEPLKKFKVLISHQRKRNRPFRWWKETSFIMKF